LLGLFSKDPQKEEADAYNQWLGDRKSAVDDLVGRFGDWDLFGTNTLGSTGTSYGSGTSDSTTRSSGRQRMDKTIGLGQRPMYDLLNAQVQDRLGKPTVTQGEIMRNVAQRNAASEGALRAAMDTAGIRGAGALQSGAGTMGIAQQRAGGIADYLGSVEKIKRDRLFQNEQAAQSLINMMLGSDTRTNQTSRTTGQTSQFGGSTGSQEVAPQIGQLANLFLPPSPQATGGGFTQNNVQDILGAGGQALAGLWGGKPKAAPPPVQQPINPWAGMSAAGL
jgi:hypothetical protein